MENTKIAIIGLGYVGLPLAVEFAKKFQVVGFDINQQRIKELRNNDSTPFIPHGGPRGTECEGSNPGKPPAEKSKNNIKPE